ncbi:hypothetical protein CW362_04745 [Streptomyces populi]|uniref:Uncharacterized protein n=1 Tax=Streptomyces populi TaxID=2058924 RepID=A0A2I0SWG3_9ACTN|nr:hypothetical protein [Streptomyces populi]PKT74262.1 hypothetical protein CW362_04745 [Streptomyces populi]
MPEKSLDERDAPPPSVPTPVSARSAREVRSYGVPAAWLTAGIAIGAGAVALAWNLSGSADDRPFTLVGQVQVAGDPGASGPCAGDHEFGDLDKGAPVTVFDSADRVVATGSLGGGTYDSFARCVFPVTVRGVPDGSKSYAVRIGLHGKTEVTNEEARTGSLIVKLGLP